MRIIGYYALHTFINGIKKLFKTWVILFILACILFGGIFGFFLGTVLPEEDMDISEYEEEIPYEEVSLTMDERTNLLTLISLGIAIVLMTLQCFNADENGSKIFSMADVNLLFSSPLKPQFILFFRMISKAILLIISGIYVLIQAGSLTDAVYSGLAILGMVLAYISILVYSELFQVLIYEISNTYNKFRGVIRYSVIALPILIIFSYGIFYINHDMDLLTSLSTFFNFEGSNFVPIYGNIKGLFYYGLINDGGKLFLETIINIVFMVLLILLIYGIKCDFYEDALYKSEEMRDLMEETENSIVKSEKKTKRKNVRLNSMKHGYGANIFFFKEMYNRFRFAKLGIFTKTCSIYTLAAISLSIFLKYVIDTTGFIWVFLMIGLFAFFRTLGNPLKEDIEKSFFILIPQSATKKMFFSLLSGSVNSMLDSLPGILISAIIFKENVFAILGALLFILSVDFYSTLIATFISLSTHDKVQKAISQAIQIMFIYFGLMPDVIILVLFGIKGNLNTGIYLSTLINILFATPFVFINPLFIETKVGTKNTKGNYVYKEVTNG